MQVINRHTYYMENPHPISEEELQHSIIMNRLENNSFYQKTHGNLIKKYAQQIINTELTKSKIKTTAIKHAIIRFLSKRNNFSIDQQDLYATIIGDLVNPKRNKKGDSSC